MLFDAQVMDRIQKQNARSVANELEERKNSDFVEFQLNVLLSLRRKNLATVNE